MSAMPSYALAAAVTACAAICVGCSKLEPEAEAEPEPEPEPEAQPQSQPEPEPEPEPESEPEPAVRAHAGKKEWAAFFARALPRSDDHSLAKQLPAWAAVASSKPLWLALLAADGRRTRAALATFENLDDKLELAHALEAAGLSELAPPTLTFEPDTPFDEIVRQIEAAPPPSLDRKGDGEAPIWVLKWAQGFGGFEIHFVRSASEAASIISAAHAETEAMREAMPGMASDEAQPGWVLQSAVPSALVRGRKIHLRTYVVALRRPGAALEFFAYERLEVRLAAKELSDDLSDSAAQLTSGTWRRGGVTARDERTTLDAAGELPPGLDARVLALLDRLVRGVPFSADARGDSGVQAAEDERDILFGVSGIDVMVDPEGRLYILELNASPSAPPPETVSAEQSDHLVEFVRRLVALLGSSEPEAVAGFTRLGS